MKSGDLPKFGVEDVADVHSRADVVLNIHSEGDNVAAALEVRALLLCALSSCLSA